ncbi:MAG: alcohol dehydrogenase catalytic domain-containing protein [Aestuariivita sp.]|nr:alcohol dehydrogenase catalytic domain-containing protein [Aestuariivita sp.]MCY4346237.1 alcohol dehydrogenase catalytic domain-containing protein [Aestuariivita sp.]
MMRAAVLVEPNQFRFEDRPVPVPQPNEVLIRLARVGVCGTDLHIFKGNYARDNLPMVIGHELSGTIAVLGKDVRGLRVDDKVVVDMNIGCGLCFWCRRNEVLNCPERAQLGITVDGAFAEYIVVPARLVIPAPKQMPFDVLALTEPLACVIRAARKAKIGFGQSVVVLGVGPIGHLHVQLVRAIGAAPIVAYDLNESRVSCACQFGADIGVSDLQELQSVVLEVTAGRGADVVVECVGLPQLYQTAMQLIRKGGHLAAFGLTEAEALLPLNILRTILEENSIKGSVAGMGQDMHDALTLLVHERINPEPLMGTDFPLGEIQSAFDSHERRIDDLKTQIVINNG